MQLRRAYFLTVAVVAIGVIHFFLYLQESGLVRENYSQLVLEEKRDWMAHVRELQAQSFLATSPDRSNRSHNRGKDWDQSAHSARAASANKDEMSTAKETDVNPKTESVHDSSRETELQLHTESTHEHSSELRKGLVEHSAESRRDVVEHSTESRRDVVEHSTESRHDVVEHSTESRHDVVEHSAESRHEIVEHSTESRREIVEHSTDLIHDIVKPSTEEASLPTTQLADTRKQIQHNTPKQLIDNVVLEGRENISHKHLHLLSLPNENDQQDHERKHGQVVLKQSSHSDSKLPSFTSQTTATHVNQYDHGNTTHLNGPLANRSPSLQQHHNSMNRPMGRTETYFVGLNGKAVHVTGDVKPPPGVRVATVVYADNRDTSYSAPGRRKVTLHNSPNFTINIPHQRRHIVWKLPNCSYDLGSHHIPSWLKNGGLTSPEISVVQKNLHKCLAAAELTDYFNEQNYTKASMRNAAVFLSLMREVVPTDFSTGHSKTQCWKSDFELHLCDWHVTKATGEEYRGFEGHINDITYRFSESATSYPIKMLLQNFYRGKIKSPLMCMPSVFVAGFPKCGSSFVFCLVEKLAKLSNRHYIVSQILKEPHFWVPSGPYFHHRSPPQYRDIAQYAVNFVPTSTVQQMISSNHSDVFSLPIDGSPNLLFQWPRYSSSEELENYCLVPSVLRQILPDSKYIVVLRNPITMLYSAFWFSCSVYCPALERPQQEMGPDIFHKKVVQKIDLFNNCTIHKPADACLMDIFSPLDVTTAELGSGQCGRVRLEVGFYYLYIRRWLGVVPRENFLFLTTDELHSNLTIVSRKVADFLGLWFNPLLIPLDSSFAESCRNVQSTYDYHNDIALQMRNDTKQLLYNFFDPFNRKLAELLQDSKYHWRP